MQTINSIHAQLGLMMWPLTIMSFITLMILLERLFFLAFNSWTKSCSILLELRQIELTNHDAISHFSKKLLAQRTTLSQGIGMLLAHRQFSKALREESVNIWLQKKRLSYTSGLRILTIIGVISPLIGLLGTVMGLIEMFKNLSSTQGGIEPALLADGLGLAMSTTAAGLLIALPAIAGAQLLNLWADGRLAKIENALNHGNLLLEGVYIEPVDRKSGETMPIGERI